MELGTAIQTLQDEIDANSQHIKKLKEQPPEARERIALISLENDNHINIQAYKDLLLGVNVKEAIERAELIKSRRQ